MIPLSIIISLLLLHFVADFLLQSSWMAQNKSKSNFPLLIHVIVYGGVFLIPSLVLFQYNVIIAFVFVLINVILHFLTDYLTSRVSSRLYYEGKLGSDTVPNLGFFSVIGFDQFIHYVTLFVSFWYLYKFI